MKLGYSKLVKRYKLALKKREPWESGYQECYDYALPGRQSFFKRDITEDAPDIYDETAPIGIQEFASRMQAGLVPNYAQWVKLEAGQEVPAEEREDINKQLEQLTAIVFEYLDASNFSQEAHEALIDIALGTATIECVNGSAIEPLMFSTTPLPELALESGPNDEIGGVYRGRRMRCDQVEKAYPGVKISKELREKCRDSSESDQDNPMVEVVIAVLRDYERPNEYAYDTYIFMPEADDEAGLLEHKEIKGKGASRFIPFRWSKIAGEEWGRGPLFNLMPAVRIANLITQMTLENAELAIAGLYFYEDDGVINPDTVMLRPGTMIPVAPGSTGVQQFNSSSDFSVGDLILTRLQENIRKGLYNETLGPTDKTPMSATEVAQRMADLSRQIGSAFGRLQVEFVNAVLDRVLFILDERGIIERPTINGRAIKIVATSPLAQAQAVEQIDGMTTWLSIMQSYYGDQGVNLYSDGAQVAEYSRERLGVPQRLYRNDESRAKMVRDMAIAQQGAAGESIEQATGQGGPAL